jgi:hypothetical protein
VGTFRGLVDTFKGLVDAFRDLVDVLIGLVDIPRDLVAPFRKRFRRPVLSSLELPLPDLLRKLTSSVAENRLFSTFFQGTKDAASNISSSNSFSSSSKMSSNTFCSLRGLFVTFTGEVEWRGLRLESVLVSGGSSG